MKESQAATLNKIRVNTQLICRDSLKRVLLLYDEKIIYLGDCCIRFDKLKYFKSFLNNATIDVNTTVTENSKFCDAFLRDNPNIDSISTLSWSEIDFVTYDAIFCVKYDEPALLEFLHERYFNLIVSDTFRVAVFSMSELLLRHETDAHFIFPVDQQLAQYLKLPRLGELHIGQGERAWADNWLESHGLQAHESLFIVCDSASIREKVINTIVYFDVLKFLLSIRSSKVLIFDEKDVGKETFYQAWLGKEGTKRIIFSKRLTLREDLRLIASNRTRLIFGPCTGLMHCASSIYNSYVSRGLSVNDVPVMITYTGQYAKEDETANFWWGNSPLVNCVILRKQNGRKQLVLLNTLPDDEKNRIDSLPCSEYGADDLIEVITSKLTLA